MMKIFNCLIADDEPPAIRLLENYIKKVSFLACVGSTSNSIEALSMINKGGIDLAFLDIQMPELTGIQLSRIIQGETKVIFTTAYPQFALESYELNAVDYLLKPFEFDRFYAAVNKLNENGNSTEIKKENGGLLFVKTDGKNNYEKISLEEIQFIESMKNYVMIHLKEKKIITYNTLKYIESQLSGESFVKTHKSFIVSLKHIDRTDSFSIYIGDHDIPIGETYKQEFFDTIKKMRL